MLEKIVSSYLKSNFVQSHSSELVKNHTVSRSADGALHNKKTLMFLTDQFWLII